MTILDEMAAEREAELRSFDVRCQEAHCSGYGILQVSKNRFHVIEQYTAHGDGDLVHLGYEIISEKPMRWEKAKDFIRKLRQL